jgi:hypothetical protein
VNRPITKPSKVLLKTAFSSAVLKSSASSAEVCFFVSFGRGWFKNTGLAVVFLGLRRVFRGIGRV